jgi:hypothetical protein
MLLRLHGGKRRHGGCASSAGQMEFSSSPPFFLPFFIFFLSSCAQVMGKGTALASMLPSSDVYLNSNDWSVFL